MPRDESTKIASDGLRYKSKEAGSPFSGSSSMGTMSCYKCGMHKPRSLGSFRKLAGQNMFCCGECNQPKWPTPVNFLYRDFLTSLCWWWSALAPPSAKECMTAVVVKLDELMVNGITMLRDTKLVVQMDSTFMTDLADNLDALTVTASKTHLVVR